MDAEALNNEYGNLQISAGYDIMEEHFFGGIYGKIL